VPVVRRPHSALRRGVIELGPSMRFDASRAQLRPATPREISLPAQQTERSSRRSHPSRQVEISRARLSRSGRGCGAPRPRAGVRVPCASNATLGNSTERVNGRLLALERRSLPPVSLLPELQDPRESHVIPKAAAELASKRYGVIIVLSKASKVGFTL